MDFQTITQVPNTQLFDIKLPFTISNISQLLNEIPKDGYTVKRLKATSRECNTNYMLTSKFKLKSDKLLIKTPFNNNSIRRYTKTHVRYPLNKNKILKIYFYTMKQIMIDSCPTNQFISNLKIKAKLLLHKLQYNKNITIKCCKNAFIDESQIKVPFVNNYTASDIYSWYLNIDMSMFEIICQVDKMNNENIQMTIKSVNINTSLKKFKLIISALKKYYSFIVLSKKCIAPLNFDCDLSNFYKNNKLTQYQQNCLRNMYVPSYNHQAYPANQANHLPYDIYTPFEKNMTYKYNVGGQLKENIYFNNKIIDFKVFVLELLNYYTFSHMDEVNNTCLYIRKFKFIFDNAVRKCIDCKNLSQCKVCNKNAFNVICRPCNHPICSDCLVTIQDNKCLHCKKSLGDNVFVFPN